MARSKSFKIGNWELVDEFIEWKGLPEIEYRIPSEELYDEGHGNHQDRYDWLVHMSEKTWLKRRDLDDLFAITVQAMNDRGIAYDVNILLDSFNDARNSLKDTEDEEYTD